MRRIASMCTGAFYLAQAGLLDERRVTTHWAYARTLQASYPKSKVEEDRIFIVDGPVWTSAGMTAGTDLALAMVEKDLGGEVARFVAKKLVMFHRRAGGQLQHSVLLDLDAKSDRIQSALAYAKEQSSYAAECRSACRCGESESAAVQPGFSRRDRALTCESG